MHWHGEGLALLVTLSNKKKKQNISINTTMQYHEEFQYTTGVLMMPQNESHFAEQLTH